MRKKHVFYKPQYSELGETIERTVGKVPVLALTATATGEAITAIRDIEANGLQLELVRNRHVMGIGFLLNSTLVGMSCMMVGFLCVCVCVCVCVCCVDEVASIVHLC
jgi:hypothetical protein